MVDDQCEHGKGFLFCEKGESNRILLVVTKKKSNILRARRHKQFQIFLYGGVSPKN